MKRLILIIALMLITPVDIPFVETGICYVSR